jgi:hypothetical protein
VNEIFIIQTIGHIRQKEMLREAENWRRIRALRQQDDRSRGYLRSIRSAAGGVLIAVGRFLTRHAPESELDVIDAKLRTHS